MLDLKRLRTCICSCFLHEWLSCLLDGVWDHVNWVIDRLRPVVSTRNARTTTCPVNDVEASSCGILCGDEVVLAWVSVAKVLVKHLPNGRQEHTHPLYERKTERKIHQARDLARDHIFPRQHHLHKLTQTQISNFTLNLAFLPSPIEENVASQIQSLNFLGSIVSPSPGLLF